MQQAALAALHALALLEVRAELHPFAATRFTVLQLVLVALEVLQGDVGLDLVTKPLVVLVRV